MSIIEIIADIVTYSVLGYSATLLGFYVFIAIYSIGATVTYLRKSRFTNFNKLLASDFGPAISILAPAYNEEATIVENIRSLLNVHYNKLEVIVINDGSRDNTLARAIEEYDLVKVPFILDNNIRTKPVRGVYKSRNPVFSKLVVVDKENGGKADALNVGINVSGGRYVVCIDVDCILEQDAIVKLIKPFLEEGKKRVIATGGVIRIANSCHVQNGKLVKVCLPKDFLPRVQTLEYIRSFLLARMAWSRLDGLLLISGAFGAFDREIVIKAGGYNHATVGEDMELVVRMRRYMEEHRLPYKVAYIPDPLCWTEVPANFTILGRQRNRWMRGTIETLKFHKIMFFNPRYRLLGLLSYPYWFFFEFLAPLVESAGFVALLFLAVMGLVNWSFFILLLVFIMSFGFLYSLFAILMEVVTYNQYRKKVFIFQLMLTALLEPILFHPFVVWSSVKGYYDYLRKKNSWGDMKRQGFNTASVSQRSQSN